MRSFIRGFTLLELLIVMAIIGILATVLVVAVNPTRQLAKARDTQRKTDLVAILSVIYQYASEHSGDLPDTDGDPTTSNFPTEFTCIGTSLECFDLAGAGEADSEIVPVYLVGLPKNPRLPDGQPGSDVYTGYYIMVDEYGHLHAQAPGETEEFIIVSR